LQVVTRLVCVREAWGSNSGTGQTTFFQEGSRGREEGNNMLI